MDRVFLFRLLGSLLRQRHRRLTAQRRRQGSGRGALRFSRPALEAMESRVLLSTMPVSATGGFLDPIEDMGRADRISGNGQYVVLTSLNALDGSDANGQNDVYLYDRGSGNVTLVSHNSAATGAGNGESLNPQISRDGDYVVFTSLADDLVAGDGNSNLDVFLYRRATGAITLVSHNGGASGDGASDVASISGDGRYIAYLSEATDLVGADGNSAIDVFLYDRVADSNTLVSHALGSGNSGNGFSDRPQVSSDGNYVAFHSDADDLTADSDLNGNNDIFLYQRATGLNLLVSQAGGASLTGSSSQPSISDDGSFLVFQSTADNLVAGDSNGDTDVFLYDRGGGVLSLLSWNSGATNGGDNASFNAQISGDGSAAVFTSNAADLVAGDGNGAGDVFYYDRGAASLAMISQNVAKTDSGNGSSFDPVVSGDGAYVLFNSLAADLAGADSNGVADAYIYRAATASIALASHNLAADDSPAGPSYYPTISNDGAYYAFTSAAPDNQLIVAADNAEEDVFLVDVASLSFNVPPVLTATAGDTLYTWAGVAVLIDDGGAVADIDSTDFDTGTLTISITTLGSANDRLTIDNQGTAPGQISTAGATVSYNFGAGAVAIGAFAGGTGLTPLTVTLNANADLVATQALMRAISYRNILAVPPAGDRVASFVLNDGDGGTSNTVTKTLHFEQNQAPSVTDPANDLDAIDEDPVVNPGTLVGDIIAGSFSDPNPNSLAGLALTVAASVSGTWQYSINGGATWVGVGAVSATSALLLRAQDLLRFVPIANFNGTRSITFKGWDRTAGVRGTKVNPVYAATGAYSSATAGANLTINPVNDPPVLGGISGAVAYTENAVLLVATAATVADVDSPNFDTGTLTVSVSNNAAAEDRLAIRNQGVGAGQIGVAGTDVTYAGVIIGSFAGGGDGFTPLVVTLNASATIAATQALIRNITYANVSDAPSTLARTLSFTVNDGDGGASNTPTRTITITAVNDFPVNSVPAAQTTPEDSTLVLSTGNGNLISVSDVDAAAGNMRITLAGTNGVVTLAQTTGLTFTVGDGLNDATTTFSGSIADLNAALDGLQFRPTASFVGACNLRTTTNDLGNTGSGGARTTITDLAITTTPVNDPPVLGGIVGAVTYIENAIPLLVAAAGTVADVDSPNFDTGSLTVQFTANGAAEDRLAIRNQGVGAGQIGVAGANVTYAGVLIGTFAGGGDGSTPLVVTLNASATIAATQALIRNITYANVSDAPSTLARTVSFTLDDGDGGTSNTPTRTVNVTAVNDAPVLTGPASNLTAIDEDDINNAGDLVGTLIAGKITDADPPVTLEGIAITARGVNGTWQFSLNGGGSWTNFPLVSNTAALLLRDTDLVRFRPALNNTTGSSITYRAWDRTAGVAGTRVSTATNGGITPYSTALLTSSITVNVLNDNPVLAGISGALAYIENAAPLLIATAGTVADADSPNFDTGSLTVQFTANGAAEDRLAIRNQGVGAGQIGVAGTDVTHAGVIIGSFAGGDGSTPLVVTLNGSANIAATQALIRNITYANVSDAPSTLARTISFTLADGDGGTSNTPTRTVNVSARNDAPLLTGPAINLTAIDEDDINNAGDLVGTLIAGKITDADPPVTLEGIAITARGVNGTWQFSLNGGGSWTNFPLVSNTAALLLRDTDLVRFRPALNNTTGSSITYRAWDRTAGVAGTRVSTATNGGITPYSTALLTSSITVNPVNDGPVVGTFAGTSTYIENAAPLILAATSTVTDVDSANFNGGTFTAWVSTNNDAGDRLAILNQGVGSGQIAVAGANISYNFGAGSILIGTFVGGDGVNPLVVSFNASATPVAARGVLRRLAYSSTNDAFTAASRVVSVAIDDGAGGVSATVNRTVNITLRNDAPVLTGINNFTNIAMNDFTNTGDLVSNLLAGFVTDPDGPAALQGIAVYQVSNVGGTWQYLNGVGAWTNFGAPGVTTARLLPDTSSVRFRPNAGFTGSSFIRLVAWDRTAGTAYGTANITTRGGLTPYSTAVAMATIQVI